MATQRFERVAHPLRGDVSFPGDKSISHRAVMFAGAASGTSHLTGVLDSADVRATCVAMEALGAKVDLSVVRDGPQAGTLSGTVTGWGEAGPVRSHVDIDCENSGTTARLLLGLLGGAGVDVTLTGDESLSRRPMARVVDPLRELGCDIELTGLGTLPAHIKPASHLTGACIDTNLSSAQVKSAILLAGLNATGVTSVTELAPSRDHTELLLPAFGVSVEVSDDHLTSSITGPAALTATDIAVPGDPSSAAFFAVATAMTPGSMVTLRDISLNPTRIAFIDVMQSMGIRIETVNETTLGAEKVGSVRVLFTPNLAGTTVEAREIPSLIDEIPILALLATTARTPTRFKGVGELRVKESDRLQLTIDGINALGGSARAEGDDLVIEPKRLSRPATLDSHGDHRFAMTWAVAGLTGPSVEVERFEAVEVSFPRFRDTISAL